MPIQKLPPPFVIGRSGQPLKERKVRLFNTAIINTSRQNPPLQGAEFRAAQTCPAFNALIEATDALACAEGISFLEAAERVVRTFRSLDSTWSEYVFRQGLETISGRK